MRASETADNSGYVGYLALANCWPKTLSPTGDLGASIRTVQLRQKSQRAHTRAGGAVARAGKLLSSPAPMPLND